ncbi:hypothetical protein GIY30_08130 [Gordonia sp. HNM0687]|uniref:Uncharacterized protein n=1 Tax=Gordonia mangrovi TaxID=2665643 RepID=A0A6L7GN33_9ACTN|nr:hypothetical protein [Gordonia mangrovi]MXP21320.1 hypothetical protein [Gordonia mangrovi]UVF80069.1 hypothetical protein NWF22_09705 [Gordonia mangrovi]
MRDFDFDGSVDDAWRAFRNDLADRAAQLRIGDEHHLEQTQGFPDGPHGTLTFTLTRAHRIRCTAHVVDLHTTPDILAEQLDALTAAGWRLLRDGRLIIEVNRRQVDRLAQVAVDALREIWEVVHPAFLEGDAPPAPEATIAVGAYPVSREHLLRLIVGALEDIAGRRITLDADGDVPLPTGSLPSWLRVLTEEPTIEFVTTLVDDVPDAAAAAQFVATESVRWPGITLVLHQTSLMAFQSVPMTAFHRENLVSAVGHWLQFTAESAPGIITAIAGTARDTAPHGDALPDPLQTLIVLDEDGSGLDAHQVATICRHDQSAILGYIRTSQEQYLEWMKSAAEADLADDADEAAACRREEQAWRTTTEKLRAALRLVVLRGDGDVPSQQVR